MPKCVRIAIDIETESNPESPVEFDESTVAVGNLKDPEKIQAKIAESRQKAQSRAALTPWFGQTLAIGIAYRGEENSLNTHVWCRNAGDTNRREAERAMLKWFTDEIEAFHRQQLALGNVAGIATFNGAGFDIPFLTIRSLLCGVKPIGLETNPYQCNSIRNHHLDLMQLFKRAEVNGEHHNLKHYAKHLLNKECDYLDDNIDKSRMGEVPTELIVKLCTWDVSTTLELAEYAQEHLGILD